LEYWKQNIQKSVSKMKANIESLKNELWDQTMDNVPPFLRKEYVALLYHLTANEGQQDWEEVANMIGEDYLVLTDEEADEKVYEYIADTVWGFTPSFLSGYTGIDEEVFVTLQEAGKYDAIRSMIQDFDGFVEAAVSADGRGHFLATYDHNEYDVTVYDTTYYIYRVN